MVTVIGILAEGLLNCNSQQSPCGSRCIIYTSPPKVPAWAMLLQHYTRIANLSPCNARLNGCISVFKHLSFLIAPQNESSQFSGSILVLQYTSSP